MHSSLSYQQATYQKYDRRGHELPSGYGPLKRAYMMIMPEYLLETDGFRMNRVNVIKEKYSITDKLGFGISACDITGSFPSPLTR